MPPVNKRKTKVIGISFNDDQQALMKILMEESHQYSITAFFVGLMAEEEKRIKAEKNRRGPGRPRSSDPADDEPLDTNTYYHPICLPLIPNDPNLKFATREEVDFYFSFRGLETPSDYFEKNIKK